MHLSIEEMAQWRCTAEGNWLGTPDLSRCTSPKIVQLENQVLLIFHVQIIQRKESIVYLRI